MNGMRAPVGIMEVEALYGDPQQYVRDDGTPGPFWEMRMVKVEMPGPLPLGWRLSSIVRTVRVNQAIAEEVQNVFRALKDRSLWDHVVTFDGAYCWRAQRGSDKLSMHAYGAALDFNAKTNQLGTKGDMDPGVIEVFSSLGWTWGGRWRRPDPMHFQFGQA